MIRHLIVLYMAVVTLLVIGTNPVPVLPLILVSLSLIIERKWLGLVGILLYGLFAFGRIDQVDMSDLLGLLNYSLALLLPLLIMLELVIAEKPYRVERISIRPILTVAGLLVGFSILLVIVIRVSRIGIYLNSDPVIQVFILMALSILFFAPVLLGGRDSGKAENPVDIERD